MLVATKRVFVATNMFITTKYVFCRDKTNILPDPPPLSPSLISLIVYMDVKHHERRRKQQTKNKTKQEQVENKTKNKKNKKKKSTRAASAHEALA